MNQHESAEALALNALAWLLGQDEQVSAFLNASGAAPSQMAQLARDPAFLGAVLDFLLEADDRVIGFCDGAGLPYAAVMQARMHLPGGAVPNWT